MLNIPTMNDQNIFVGVKSDEPITRIVFDEDSGSDDIAVRDFRFGTVPEPGSSILILTSCLMLLARCR